MAYGQWLDKAEKNKEFVDFKKRLEEVYTAIFCSDDSCSVTEIDRCEFSNRTKKEIIDAATLLSDYVTYWGRQGYECNINN